MKPMTTKKLEKLLRKNGARPDPQGGKGSHVKWIAPGGHTTTYKGGADEQSPGTLRNIQRHLAPEFGDTWIEDEQK